jgi:hypothetical protein
VTPKKQGHAHPATRDKLLIKKDKTGLPTEDAVAYYYYYVLIEPLEE